MKEKLESIKKEFDAEIEVVKNLNEAENLRVKFLGKKGLITLVMPMLRDVPNDQKREMGMLVNEVKNHIQTCLDEKVKQLNEQEIENQINNAEKIDITLPVETGVGSLHPRTIIQKEVEDVFI